MEGVIEKAAYYVRLVENIGSLEFEFSSGMNLRCGLIDYLFICNRKWRKQICLQALGCCF